jgi:hypothetical protein
MATAMSVSALPPGMGYPDEGEGGETARQQRSVSQPAPLLDQCEWETQQRSHFSRLP